MSTLSRILNVFRSRRVNSDIEEELRSHMDEAHQSGHDPKHSFGSQLRTREAMRDSIVAPWLESIVADVVFGWRQLTKRKAASAAAIVSLGLGIGACTAAFRLIDALLLRPLPVAEPGSLYSLGYEVMNEHDQTDIGTSLNYPGFRLMRAAVKDQAEMMAISFANRINVTYGDDQELERVYRQYVSGWTFAEFGLKPTLGRLFTERDDITPGAHPYAVLSYDYWTRRFGRDPAVIGRKFREGNDTFEIVGVAPKGFTGTETGTFTDLFVPTMMFTRGVTNSGMQWFRGWVKLRPGADREQVREKLRATFLASRREALKSFGPGTSKQRKEQYVSAGVVLEPAAAGVSQMQKTYRRALVILGALVAMVLLIACVNVANLMTAQAASRAREMALRVSIGAGRARLIQLVLIESALIATASSILGTFFAWWAAPFVVGMINPPNDPARLTLPADWRVTAFAIILAFTVAILFGLAPALRASSVKPASALKGGDDPHTRRRLMHALVAAQVAFCFLVHFVAGLFISSFDRLANQPTGFSSARVIALDSVSRARQPSEAWGQVADHLRSVAGVESASVAGWALMSGTGWNGSVWANGRSPEDQPLTWFLAVSPHWFETMKIPLAQGRDFRPGESYPEAAVVNETFARRYFDGQNPVGRTFETQNAKDGRTQVEIVGLVRDAQYTDLDTPVPATVYAPFQGKAGSPGNGYDRATFLVRTKDAGPMSLAAVLRAEIPRGHPEIRVANIVTQEELVRAHTIRARVLAMLSLFFAVVALVLAGVGLYGVLDYAVLERRRELGIRIALGARAGDIARRVTVEIFAMLALGAAVGLGLGIASDRYIGNLLYQVKTTDPSILLLPTVTILAAALLAALPPVLRAVRIDPTTLLRAE